MQKAGFRAKSWISGCTRWAPTVGAHRVHPEIHVFCHGRPRGRLKSRFFAKSAHMGAHGKKSGFQGAHTVGAWLTAYKGVLSDWF